MGRHFIIYFVLEIVCLILNQFCWLLLHLVSLSNASCILTDNLTCLYCLYSIICVVHWVRKGSWCSCWCHAAASAMNLLQYLSLKSMLKILVFVLSFKPWAIILSYPTMILLKAYTSEQSYFKRYIKSTILILLQFLIYIVMWYLKRQLLMFPF